MKEEATLSKLRWRCRRGMLELDCLLLTFLEHGYGQLSDAQRAQFYCLLKYSDQSLLECLTGRQIPSDKGIRLLVQRIRDTAALPTRHLA